MCPLNSLINIPRRFFGDILKKHDRKIFLEWSLIILCFGYTIIRRCTSFCFRFNLILLIWHLSIILIIKIAHLFSCRWLSLIIKCKAWPAGCSLLKFILVYLLFCFFFTEGYVSFSSFLAKVSFANRAFYLCTIERSFSNTWYRFSWSVLGVLPSFFDFLWL